MKALFTISLIFSIVFACKTIPPIDEIKEQEIVTENEVVFEPIPPEPDNTVEPLVLYKGNTDTLNVENERLTFANIQPILARNCGYAGWSACHGDEWSKYEYVAEVIEKGDFSQEVFVLKRMPKVGKLTDEELAKLKAWVNDGYPEE